MGIGVWAMGSLMGPCELLLLLEWISWFPVSIFFSFFFLFFQFSVFYRCLVVQMGF
jgi:hypothetical protein